MHRTMRRKYFFILFGISDDACEKMNDESFYIERFIENWHPAINVFNGYQSNDIAVKQDYKLAFNSFKKAFVFLSDSMRANFSSAFLLFFRNSLAPSKVYFRSLSK